MLHTHKEFSYLECLKKLYSTPEDKHKKGVRPILNTRHRKQTLQIGVDEASDSTITCSCCSTNRHLAKIMGEMSDQSGTVQQGRTRVKQHRETFYKIKAKTEKAQNAEFPSVQGCL